MLAQVCDKTVKFNSTIHKLTEGEFFMVYMEEVQSVGHRGLKPVESNVWRVWYTDRGRTYVKHYVNRERAEVGFKEAIMFNGFLGID